MKRIISVVILGAMLGTSWLSQATPVTKASAGSDPYLWLEKTHGKRAMQWVHKADARTEKRFASGPEFKRLFKRILEVYDSDARVPGVTRRGRYLYNFWQDKQHPRGVWRRTTLTEYRKAKPKWEILLDIGALNKAEGKNWVYKSAQCLRPEYNRCLISLSPGGGDAVEVREFDIPSKSFVKGGFFLPVAKSQVSWIDRDHVFVGTDFGPESMTASGYPRIVKEWTRGTPLSQARLIKAGKHNDMTVAAFHDDTPGFERSFVLVYSDIFHKQYYLLKDGKLVALDVPTDAAIDFHRRWMLVHTKSDWTVGGKTWPSGSLLVTDFADFMHGKHAMHAVYTPDAHSALSDFAWTRHHLIINELVDVKSRLYVLTPGKRGWSRKALKATPALATVKIADTDPVQSDEYWLKVTGFLTPNTLMRGVLGEQPAKAIKREKAFFDASKFTVSQHFATSKDGTRVPYFEVAPKGIKLDGSNRTQLYGYGGFGVNQLPGYSGSIGRGWLERGGVFVMANIRGGGEYGPRWHQAAMKSKRHKAYEDFAAVARDLIRRGVTSPAHLAARGGSNGGLLAGNMLVSYPQLFGAVSSEVPLLDMKRYVYLDAGASWIAEYGDPRKPKQWAYIKTFSPYQLVRKGQQYPTVLFSTTTSDDRVGPAQARKMAAKMQGMGYRNAWFYESTEGGHGYGADNKESAHTYALFMNFLWESLR